MQIIGPLWYREIGIADNFINENSERELLAVLSHEIGHMKYKKTIIDYIPYVFAVLLLSLMVLGVSYLDAIPLFGAYIQQSFGLQMTNYYLLMVVATSVIYPFVFLFNILSNYCTRKEEYAADANAVTNGYGQELKETFMKVSEETLMNVNPAPIVEFLEYNHPSIYNRIKAINEVMENEKINKIHT